MSVTIYLITIFMGFGTILLVFGMRYLASSRQTQSRIANETAYRDLVAKATTAQSETAAALAAIQAVLAETTARLSAVEKILKDVG